MLVGLLKVFVGLCGANPICGKCPPELIRGQEAGQC